MGNFSCRRLIYASRLHSTTIFFPSETTHAQEIPFSCSKPNAFSDVNFERVQELDACTCPGRCTRPKLRAGGTPSGSTSWFCGSGCGSRYCPCHRASDTGWCSGRGACSARGRRCSATTTASTTGTCEVDRSGGCCRRGDRDSRATGQQKQRWGRIYGRSLSIGQDSEWRGPSSLAEHVWLEPWLPQRDRGSSRDPARWESR